MRQFSIFVQSSKKSHISKKSYPINILTEFPGSSKLPELDLVVDGSLKLISESKEFYQFKVNLEYHRRKSGISDKSYKEKGSFEIWQHKGGFCVSVDSSRALSKVAAAFLSVVQFDELKAIRLLEMDLNRYMALKQYAIKLGGGINMLHLKNVMSEGINLNVITVHGKDVGKMKVDEMLKGAKKIKRIGFFIPNLISEYYSFWVADWGGGAIYSPTDFLPHQVAGLLDFFEQALIPNRLKN